MTYEKSSATGDAKAPSPYPPRHHQIGRRRRTGGEPRCPQRQSQTRTPRAEQIEPRSACRRIFSGAPPPRPIRSKAPGTKTATASRSGIASPHARQHSQRRYRRHRDRSLPPLQGRRRADEVARRAGLPFLDLLAAHFSARHRRAESQGLDFYERLIDELLAKRHRAVRHALSLGFAAGAAGPRRLGNRRHRQSLRRLCRLRRRQAQRPGRSVSSPSTSSTTFVELGYGSGIFAPA